MKRVTHLGENDVIHCVTPQEDAVIRKLLHEAGKTWFSGESFLEKSFWHLEKKNHCIRPFIGTRGHVAFFKENGFIVNPASDFIPPKLIIEDPELFNHWSKSRPIEKWMSMFGIEGVITQYNRWKPNK